MSKRIEREKEKTYQPVGQRVKCAADNKPEDTITREASESANQKNDPRRELVGCNTWYETNIFTYVIGHTKHGQLSLVETQNRFQRVRVKWKSVGIACCYLDPNCCSQSHPWRSGPCFNGHHGWKLLENSAQTRTRGRRSC